MLTIIPTQEPANCNDNVNWIDISCLLANGIHQGQCAVSCIQNYFRQTSFKWPKYDKGCFDPYILMYTNIGLQKTCWY